MAKKNDNNFKKAMNELLGAPVKEEPAKAPAKESAKVEEPKKAEPVKETVAKEAPVVKTTGETAVIPAGMVITGNITTQSDMRIEGNIVGDITCEGNILLFGSIDGNVNANNITFHKGTMKGDVVVKADAVLEEESSLKGNLTATNVLSNAKSQGQIFASGTVELQNQAFVHGDITAATFSVTSGAKIKGAVTINE